MKLTDFTSDSNMRYVKEFYDRKYEKGGFKRHYFLDRLFILSIISKYKIRQNVWILDVGCGTGWYTYLLARSNLKAKVVGVDLSRTALLEAKRAWKGQNIHWIVGDANNLPINNKFAAVLCSGLSLFNVPDLKACSPLIKNLSNYLKPDGLFIFIESSNLSGIPTTVANHSLKQVFSFFFESKIFKGCRDICC